MKKLVLFAAAVIVLTACSSDNEPQEGDARNLAHFSATIGVPQSRAFDQTWESGDEIGITGSTTYTNIGYTTIGDGNFSAINPGTAFYYHDNSSVTFTAYYPYVSDAAHIIADTKKQADQKKFDYLWAQSTGSKASPNVSFCFAHKMSKVVITIRKGVGVSFNQVNTAVLNLGGFKSEGEFNAATGVTTATGETSSFDFANCTTTDFNAPVTKNTDSETVTYTLIFFPQEFSQALPFTATVMGQSFRAALDFTAANAAAKDSEPKNEWVAGRQYNLSVTLNNTTLTVNSCTILPWNIVDGGNFDAE